MKRKILLILTSLLIVLSNKEIAEAKDVNTLEFQQYMTDEQIDSYVDEEREKELIENLKLNGENDTTSLGNPNVPVAGICEIMSQNFLFGQMTANDLYIINFNKETEKIKTELKTIRDSGYKINFDIYKVVNDEELEEGEKVAKVAQLLCESPEVKITYKMNGKITGWTQLKEKYEP